MCVPFMQPFFLLWCSVCTYLFTFSFLACDKFTAAFKEGDDNGQYKYRKHCRSVGTFSKIYVAVEMHMLWDNIMCLDTVFVAYK